MNWTVSPSPLDLNVESLIPNMNDFGDGAFKEVI